MARGFAWWNSILWKKIWDGLSVSNIVNATVLCLSNCIKNIDHRLNEYPRSLAIIVCVKF